MQQECVSVHQVFVENRFNKFARKAADLTGTPWAFMVAALLIVVWLISGPIFKFGDTWQLVINTGTTIITFLMVFVIQNTQNRDSKAMHLKIDELLRANEKARNALMELEQKTDSELAEYQKEFDKLCEGGDVEKLNAEWAESYKKSHAKAN